MKIQLISPQAALQPGFNTSLVNATMAQAKTQGREAGVRREIAPRQYAELPDGTLTTDIASAVAYDSH